MPSFAVPKFLKPPSRSDTRHKTARAPVALGGCALLVAAVLFACSSLRHRLFASTAMDLGFFDQALYLISRGELPVISFWGHHVLGGHADYSLYLLAGLYKLYADPHWLLALQALSLAGGGALVAGLARQRGTSLRTATTLALAFWLYPPVFNVNLFDFHPEVMAVPGLLGCVLWARRSPKVPAQLRPPWELGGFVLLLLFVLGCKAALSLTVAAMGVWLCCCERRPAYGVLALLLGVSWFAIATQVVIPAFRPDGVEAVFRYGYLGDSLGEIAANLVLKPQLALGQLLSAASWRYLALLLFPVAWGLSPRHLAPLIAAAPTLGLNLLSEHPLQRSLEHQYALPILPFLFVAVVDAVAAKDGIWCRLVGDRDRRVVLAWCAVALLLLGNPNKLLRGLEMADTQAASQAAIARIPPTAKVLTDNYLAPHLMHRQTLLLVGHPSPLDIDLDTPNYVVLNARHPWRATSEVVRNLVEYFLNHPDFELRYLRDDVFVFASPGRGAPPPLATGDAGVSDSGLASFGQPPARRDRTFSFDRFIVVLNENER